ncbi:MAG: hypothetical protein LBB88_04915 [Planctomycetaceae bacterium]|jgi:hypothetical protein|nr:hypothetical protein [Planctomycetaceae bacterium]
MFRSIVKFGFQRVVAVLLLVTFAPLVILSEATHLIPGLGENCDCFKVIPQSSLPSPNVGCSHNHGSYSDRDFADGISAKFIEVGHENYNENISGTCPLHSFCQMFNSLVIVIVTPVVSELAVELTVAERLSFSDEFFSSFQARAPPIA